MTFVFRQHHGHPPAILVMGQPATADVSRLFPQHGHLGWLLASLARLGLLIALAIPAIGLASAPAMAQCASGAAWISLLENIINDFRFGGS
jgi:hypothetical protein